MTTLNDGKITCLVDNARVHSVHIHLRDNHPDWDIERYKTEFPDEPLLSELAAAKVASHKASREAKKPAVQTDVTIVKQAYLHDVFGFGNVPAALGSSGNPISIAIIEGVSEECANYVEPIDADYVFNIDLVKKVIVGFELNMPVYLWGYHGTGKTTVLEQCAARTGRPWMRVQHTINTEESHILGQYVVRNGGTEFQLGPLPLAMLNGMIYCADEYDYAMPGVSAVYQPVLEGKALVIKDAPPEYRKIHPHPNFRFVATGNTNGVGDETGLYQGTLIQNAANYSRFPITEEVQYMDQKIEESVMRSKTGIDPANATKLVKFAKAIRESFADGKIGMPISPRELINATTLGIAFGGNMILGLMLSYGNRQSRIDKKLVEETAQRIFG